MYAHIYDMFWVIVKVLKCQLLCLEKVLKYLTHCDLVDCRPSRSSVHVILQAGKMEWAANPFSRGIFLTQGLDPGLPHCRQILFYLIHLYALIYHVLGYNPVEYSTAESIPVLATGNSFTGGSCVSTYPHQRFLFVYVLHSDIISYFKLLLCIYYPVLESTNSSRSPSYIYWRMVLETKIPE